MYPQYIIKFYGYQTAETLKFRYFKVALAATLR